MRRRFTFGYGTVGSIHDPPRWSSLTGYLTMAEWRSARRCVFNHERAGRSDIRICKRGAWILSCFMQYRRLFIPCCAHRYRPCTSHTPNSGSDLHTAHCSAPHDRGRLLRYRVDMSATVAPNEHIIRTLVRIRSASRVDPNQNIRPGGSITCLPNPGSHRVASSSRVVAQERNSSCISSPRAQLPER